MNRKLAGALSVAVVLSVVYLAFAKLTPYYLANDDVALRTLVEGTFQGVPDAYRHLVMFSNVLFGKFLVWLYDQFPGVTWYDYVSLALNLVALAAISFCLFEQVTRWYAVLAVYLLSLSWALVFFVSPQFTLTAALLGGAGVTLAASTLLGEGRGTWRLVAAFLLAAAGCLVRSNAVLLIVLAGSLYALPLLIGSDRRRVIPIAMLLAAFFAFAYATDRYDRREYATTEGFENVKALNLARAQWQELALNPAFNSPSNREAVRGVLESTPLDATRMELLRSWVFADASVNLQNLRATMDAVTPYVSKTQNLSLALNEFERSVFYKVEETFGFILLVLVACLVWPGRRSMSMAAWTLGVFGVLFALIFLLYKMPPLRVTYPMLFLAAVFVIFAGARDSREVPGEASRGRGAALLIVAAVCAAHLGVQREKSFHYWPYYRSARDAVRELDPQFRYVTFGAVLPVTRLAFPYKPNAVLDDLNILRNGWTSILPYIQTTLFGESLDGTVVDLVCAPATRVAVTNEKPEVLEDIGTYARVVQGRLVDFDLVEETGPFDLYECREGRTAPPRR